MNKPLCPYCGEHNGHPDGVVMQPMGGAIARRFRCPECDAMSPLKDDADSALASALQRFQPPKKPLTLEEIKELHTPFALDVPPFLWLEVRDYVAHGGSQWVSISDLIEICKLEPRGMEYSHPHPLRACIYGVDFRAWWKRPTDAESAAAKWAVEGGASE